jgi:hypothetical protein
MFPGSLHQPLATILLVGGLLTCFLGYRLFRFVLAGFGLFFGAIGIVWMIGSTDLWVLVVAVLAGALVGGLMFFAVYYIGVAIVGAGLGAAFVYLLWIQRTDDPHALLVILFAIIGAFAALLLQRYVLIIGTAFGGAWTSIVGGLALTGQEDAVVAVSNLGAWFSYPLDIAAAKHEVLLSGWLVVGLLGVVVQLRKTGKAHARRHK